MGGVLALALSRELTPVVTSIIIAGRVGSAFAAELGTMQVGGHRTNARQCCQCCACGWVGGWVPTRCRHTEVMGHVMGHAGTSLNACHATRTAAEQAMFETRAAVVHASWRAASCRWASALPEGLRG